MKYLLVIFLSLLMTNFFGATAIPNTILLVLLVPFVIMEFYQKSVFKWYIYFVLIGLFLSILSCYYFRGQSIILTFKASARYFYIVFYFLLRYIDFEVRVMEKAIFWLAIIFCFCYIIQFIVYPVVIFGGAETEFINDVRIRLAGQGISSLGYFFGINRFLRTKNRSFLLLAILCFGVIFLMGFRTMLFMIVLFTFMTIIRIHGFSWKILRLGVLCVGILIIVLQFPVFAEKIANMEERQENQVFSNSDYIRVIQFEYFTQDHFKNFGEYILGSGMPASSTGKDNSMYGQYMEGLTDKGIYWVDLGLLGLSWIIGITSVLFMIIYSIKAYRLKVGPDNYYLGIWFLYLVASSFTTMEFYRPGNFMVQAIALYLIEKVNKIYLIKTRNRQLLMVQKIQGGDIKTIKNGITS